MAYQVIARKYRPQRFDDVVGQGHVTQTLTNAIAQSRIAHAYLFCGPRGTGKTTIARIFAKCLNCSGGPRVDFADDDPRCLEIAEGRSLDVFEIDGASNRGIEEIRELRETARYAPAAAKFKIYIIDEVHMLTKEAFNALLKTLEEPPAHVKFMFATTEPEKVLPTILSRCQRFDLRRIPAALIVRHLAHVAAQEKVTADETALYAIARGAEGAMRDAQSTLDQLISFCGDRVQEADVLSMFGLTAQDQIRALFAALLAGDAEAALSQLDALSRHGKDLARLLSDLLGHCRNLLLFELSHGDLNLLQVSEAEAAALASQCQGVAPGVLTRLLDVLADYEGRLRDSASKRILVEIALLKAIEARQAVSLDDVLKQLLRLRGNEVGAATASPAPSSGSVGSDRSKPAGTHSRGSPAVVAPVATPTVTNAVANRAADLAGLWRQVLDGVGRASPFAKSYLVEAHPIGLEKDVLTVGFDPEFAEHLELVNNEKNRNLLQTKLAELGYAGLQVRFIKSAAPAAAGEIPSETPKPSSSLPAPPGTVKSPANSGRLKSEPLSGTKEDFKDDPLIQKALEIFKGQIVEVRA
jgi:DNA polymerase-3 subunit gamma/tau